MEKVFIGKIVNTHGIKGEFRIKSDFEMKEKVFKIGNKIIIKNNTYEIASYRVHKGYDMITLTGFYDINQVIPFKGLNVFFNREDLELGNTDYILEDLIDMELYLDDELIGKAVDYTTGQNPLLCVKNEKTFYIPLKGNFIKEVDLDNKRIKVSENVRGLML